MLKHIKFGEFFLLEWIYFAKWEWHKFKRLGPKVLWFEYLLSTWKCVWLCIFYYLFTYNSHPTCLKNVYSNKEKRHSSIDLIVIDGIVIKYANEWPMAFSSSSGWPRPQTLLKVIPTQMTQGTGWYTLTFKEVTEWGRVFCEVTRFLGKSLNK